MCIRARKRNGSLSCAREQPSASRCWLWQVGCWTRGSRRAVGQVPSRWRPAPRWPSFFSAAESSVHARWSAHRLNRRLALASAGPPRWAGTAGSRHNTSPASIRAWSGCCPGTDELPRPDPAGPNVALTAGAFLLEGGALMLLLRATRWRLACSMAALLALAATAINLVVLVGYAYGAPLLYGGATIPAALPTALAFVLLGAGAGRSGAARSAGSCAPGAAIPCAACSCAPSCRGCCCSFSWKAGWTAASLTPEGCEPSGLALPGGHTGLCLDPGHHRVDRPAHRRCH